MRIDVLKLNLLFISLDINIFFHVVDYIYIYSYSRYYFCFTSVAIYESVTFSSWDKLGIHFNMFLLL